MSVMRRTSAEAPRQGGI